MDMQSYFLEYANVLVFFILGVILGLILLGLSFFLSNISKERTLHSEKLSAYECGFDPFADSRGKFNIHFYLIGILFIIFDLEVVILFPWACNLGCTGSFSF